MSDRGTQMRSHCTRRYFALLDIDQLFGWPGTPNDQARIDALFPNPKTHPFHAGRFEAYEAASAWCANHFRWYNEEHHHSALDFVTPAQRHSGDHVRILEERRRKKAQSIARRRAYRVARKRRPQARHEEAASCPGAARAVAGL